MCSSRNTIWWFSTIPATRSRPTTRSCCRPQTPPAIKPCGRRCSRCSAKSILPPCARRICEPPAATARHRPMRWRAGYGRRSGSDNSRIPALKHFADSHDVDLLVGGRRRTSAVQELLLAKTDGLKPLRRNLEGVYQDFTDHVGPPLAQRQIVFAPARRRGMAANQEFVSQQRRMVERISDAPQYPIRLVPNDGRDFNQFNFGHKLRQRRQLSADGRPLYRRCIGLRLNAFQGLLSQGSDIQIRRGFKPGKLVDPFFRCAGRLSLRRSRKRREADQRDHEQTDVVPTFPPRSHPRYPASPMALWQFMLTPRGPANRQSSALAVSPFWTPAQNLVTSRSHNLVTAARAATRFWIASKARP